MAAHGDQAALKNDVTRLSNLVAQLQAQSVLYLEHLKPCPLRHIAVTTYLECLARLARHAWGKPHHLLLRPLAQLCILL